MGIELSDHLRPLAATCSHSPGEATCTDSPAPATCSQLRPLVPSHPQRPLAASRVAASGCGYREGVQAAARYSKCKASMKSLKTGVADMLFQVF